jgi:hypothetical protein
MSVKDQTCRSQAPKAHRDRHLESRRFKHHRLACRFLMKRAHASVFLVF